ncbi:hypothetical protein JHK85_018692 [Glycine max]|nr:hypothetical protein JHK85_018692 [Glycine max]
METDLKELQQRYSKMSLRFVEVEGERQKLVMTVRNIKNARKAQMTNIDVNCIDIQSPRSLPSITFINKGFKGINPIKLDDLMFVWALMSDGTFSTMSPYDHMDLATWVELNITLKGVMGVLWIGIFALLKLLTKYGDFIFWVIQ